jgi:hypothetical protein
MVSNQRSYRGGGSGTRCFLGAELSIRGKQEAWKSAGDFYPLTEPDSHCELLAIWKKQCPLEPIVSNFIDVLEKDLGSPQVSTEKSGANLDRASVNHSRDNDLTPDSTVRSGPERA